MSEAKFRTVRDYVRAKPVVIEREYIRFVERTAEQMNREVEYDMDDEDDSWLRLMNAWRKNNSLKEVSQDVFEMLMDRFEKEAFFQVQNNGGGAAASDDPFNNGIDEDAVCAVCMDGECHNANVILFCDVCNLAVHQECYGVPYVPEGQWLCRRCVKSPSKALTCCLCPNQGGAFKETASHNKWAHVVCAIWIPEVCFANTVFLEPIEGVENIPDARWKLTCYICKQRGVGACIQCMRPNCYTAFHVTCAQQAGLYMKIEPSGDSNHTSPGQDVRKSAFCDAHCPVDTGGEGQIVSLRKTSANGPAVPSRSDSHQDRLVRMRKARKLLAERRSRKPPVSVPVIPSDKISDLCREARSWGVSPDPSQFVERLYAYWTLKRKSRYGVPLLRRLQTAQTGDDSGRTADRSTNSNGSRSNGAAESDSAEHRKVKFYYWKRLREDLERGRTLAELVRKRERIKRDHVTITRKRAQWRLDGLHCALQAALNCLKYNDVNGFFMQPVSPSEVDYYKVISDPMDFSTMQRKIDQGSYESTGQFAHDFCLIWENCQQFNHRTSQYHKAAAILRDKGSPIIDQLETDWRLLID